MFRKLLTVAVIGVAGLLPATDLAQAGSLRPLDKTSIAHPKDYDVFTVNFKAGEIARVWVTNLTTGADLDVRVIDPLTLQVLAQDNRVSRDATVQFFPPRRGEYIIVVHNFSSTIPARYRVTTN